MALAVLAVVASYVASLITFAAVLGMSHFYTSVLYPVQAHGRHAHRH
eukprot:CAMPEP_0119493454 /NCGR_PEP_ID=MMETSP1344-20130328/17705_1 /TAXON_ID=236787 /ORGANISM="Florenciella parvula, Strain CCMP2471" /LENGTH=46 /DNA_ID= /DNA_START= /DNA_END= /DNA_ORIENTATION=